MEQLCELYHQNHGLSVVGLRYFTVFGPRQRPNMAFHRLCRAALEGTEFTVFGTGDQTRDFTYVADVIDVTRAAAEVRTDGPRLFNVGGGSPASLREVIDQIGEFAEVQLAVRYAESESGDVRDTEADTSLAREHLGFTPQVTLAEGLRAQLAWAAKTLAGLSSR